MRCHRLFAGDVRERPRHPLRQPPGVDENKRCTVLLDQRGETFIDLAPHLARHHRFQRRVRNFDREVPRTLMAGIDDLTRRRLLRM